MLGIVFNEFLNVVEDTKGLDYLEDLLESQNLSSGGAYSSLGNYEVSELVQLVTAFSQEVDMSIDELLTQFGSHLANVFYDKYPEYFSESNLFEFLEKLDSHIHENVKKLYSSATPPRFITKRDSPTTMQLQYVSKNSFHSLAIGLVEGCANIFKEDINVDLQLTSEGTFIMIEVENAA
jgi:hypothetical protein